jgi:hypothetical protein
MKPEREGMFDAAIYFAASPEIAVGKAGSEIGAQATMIMAKWSLETLWSSTVRGQTSRWRTYNVLSPQA